MTDHTTHEYLKKVREYCLKHGVKSSAELPEDGMHEKVTKYLQKQKLFLVPNRQRSLFWIVFIFAIVVCYILARGFYDTETWEHNVVKDTFGHNSLCLVFDYAPSIYVGPWLYAMALVFAVPYLCGNAWRVEILRQHDQLSKTSVMWYRAACLIEILSMCFFSTIFAVNDESIKLHVMAYVQVIVFLLIGAWRNLWYSWNFSPHFHDTNNRRKKVFIFYVAVFTIFGLLYGINLTTTIFGSRLIADKAGVIDKVFTFLVLCQGLMLCVNGAEDGYLEISATLVFPPEDGQGCTFTSPFTALQAFDMDIGNTENDIIVQLRAELAVSQAEIVRLKEQLSTSITNKSESSP